MDWRIEIIEENGVKRIRLINEHAPPPPKKCRGCGRPGGLNTQPPPNNLNTTRKK